MTLTTDQWRRLKRQTAGLVVAAIFFGFAWGVSFGLFLGERYYR